MRQITFDDLKKVDIRTGTILKAECHSKARKSAFMLKIDFGPRGINTSSAQLTQNYEAGELIGTQIVAIVNFPAKRIAGVQSEVLGLGAHSTVVHGQI